MSDSTKQPTAGNPAEPVAVQYVETQLVKTRRSLRRTRALMIGAVGFVAVYMGCLTYFLHEHLLQPEPAAQLATHYVTTFVRENGPEISQHIVTEVPTAIRRLPDMAIKEMPKARRQFEDRAQAVLKQYTQEIAPKVGEEIDRFLAAHQAEIKEFLIVSQDPVLVEKLGEQLESDIREMLSTKDERGMSAMDCLHEHLLVVQSVQEHMHRLATATNLTPQEKQLRRAIAVLLHAMEQPHRA